MDIDKNLREILASWDSGDFLVKPEDIDSKVVAEIKAVFKDLIIEKSRLLRAQETSSLNEVFNIGREQLTLDLLNAI